MEKNLLRQYHQLLKDISENGELSSNRTGVDTYSIFGYQMRFNLQHGFPAVTTKKLMFKSVVAELLWFLEGSIDERRLAELTFGKDRTEITDKKTIWTENADAQGKALGYTNTEFEKELGPVYGYQWRMSGRKFKGKNKGGEIDQILNIINLIKYFPDSRRMILNAWNASQISEMALPPCHLLCQFRVFRGKLSCHLYIRSNDVFLGAPFNIASYALLTHIIARECNMEVGELIYSIGDAHIYVNHQDQIAEQLSRKEYRLPSLRIEDDFKLLHHEPYPLDAASKISLHNYKHHPHISAPMAV